ncbi:MAG: lactate racemase domain-containing protein [Lentisphaeria bacterium]|nr:lactate racemase domain-containing protein [Lentisphaeria bacterium]
MSESVSLVRETGLISAAERNAALDRHVEEILSAGARRVLLLPPDITRMNSDAGPITAYLYARLSPSADVDIMPTLGTHMPMTDHELRVMFGDTIPLSAFKVHDWRHDIECLGEVPGELLSEWSEGKLDFSVKVEVNTILRSGYDRLVSIGQVVPHEVVGLANYTKNICVGAGGFDIINKSHFLGAVHGMERIMGQMDTPVRKLFNYAVSEFMGDLPIRYILTVMAKDESSGVFGMKGLFIGDGDDVFENAAVLSQNVNIIQLDEPLRKVVVYLDPEEFKTTWLGNKAVYRTRMAMADNGELIVLAPGLKQFGEDLGVDTLIRRHGYRGTEATLRAVKDDPELAASLGAAAHLVHGSSEGRFTITYCPGDGMDLDTVRSVGYEAAPLADMTKKYNPETLKDGFNTLADGEVIFFISNPALGLWGLKENF